MTGKAPIDILISALNLVGIFAGLGIYIYGEFFLVKPMPDSLVEFAEMQKELMKMTEVSPVKLERLVINLPSSNRRLRYLDLESSVLPYRNEDKPQLKELTPVLMDTIIDMVGMMDAQEINSISGKILLEGRIKKTFSERTKTDMIKDIFFTKAVVQ